MEVGYICICYVIVLVIHNLLVILFDLAQFVMLLFRRYHYKLPLKTRRLIRKFLKRFSQPGSTVRHSRVL